MGFKQATRSVFKRFLQMFKGRASRSEYWYFVLFSTLLTSVLIAPVVIWPYLLLKGFILNLTVLTATSIVFLFYVQIVKCINAAFIFMLFFTQVRRLHDINRTGWWLVLPCAALIFPVIAYLQDKLHPDDRTLWLCLGIIPVVATTLLLFTWFCTKGTKGENRFGADPLATAAKPKRIIKKK